MKKIGVLVALLVVISMFSFVFADEPNLTVPGSEDIEKIQDAVDQIPIDPETGGVDEGRVIEIKSRAEERVDKINEWLDENAAWLYLVFRMNPQLSWLFAINVYFILLFFVSLVLNGNVFFFALPFSEAAKRVVGLCLFVILLILNVIRGLSVFVWHLWELIYNYVLPWGAVAIVIIVILAIVVLILLAMYAPQVLIMLKNKIEERKENKKKEKADIERKALEKLVEGAIGRG